MKKLFASLGAALMMLTTAVASDFDDLRNVSVQINENCSATIVKSVKGDDGDVETKLLTARHCVPEDEGVLNIKEHFRGKPVKNANYFYDVHRKNKAKGPDLAVLQLRDKETQFPVARVAQEQGEFGDVTYALGYPLGRSLTITQGNLGDYEMIKDEVLIRSTPGIFFGNSGGGLFNEDHELIGVASRVVPGTGFMGFFVPLEEIQEILEKSAVTIEWDEEEWTDDEKANRTRSG